MKKAILSLAILLSLSLTFSISCGGNSQPPSELPTWNIGDTWTTRTISEDGTESTATETVTGEEFYNGIECYTTEVEVEAGEHTRAYDKTTLMLVRDEYSSIFDIFEWTVRTVITSVSCEYSVNPYPISVGKTWMVTGNMTHTTMYEEDAQTTDQTIFIPFNVMFEVEKVETIIVPAGTFECFKILEYDENNSVTTTTWVTDLTRGWPVKEVDNISGSTSELISYSLCE